MRRAWPAQRDQIIRDVYRIANILEDAHVDFWVGRKWPVLGEYIRVARGRMKERTPIDLDAIASQSQPDRDGVANLWINASLYSRFPEGLPTTWDDSWWRDRCPTQMRAAALRAMEYLMGLTRKAVGDRPGQRDHWDRFLLALEALIYLYRFPVSEPPPAIPQVQGGQAGGGQGTTTPSQPQGSKPSSGGAGAGQAEGAAEDEDQASGGTGAGQAEGGAEDEDQASGETGGEEQQGGHGAGKVGNPSASSGQALDAFGPRHRGQVVEIPKALLDQVLEALINEVEDLTSSVAEVLAANPHSVAAQARKADDDPELARKITGQVMPQVREIRRVFDRQQDAQSLHLKGLPRGKVDDRG